MDSSWMPVLTPYDFESFPIFKTKGLHEKNGHLEIYDSTFLLRFGGKHEMCHLQGHLE